MNILLVEDEAGLGQSLSRLLAAEGHVVRLARNVAHAEQSLEPAPDVVVMDWMLPDGSGLELVRRWRARRLQVPVIMLSARAQVAEKVLALEAGADDYMTKPFEPLELMARIRVQARDRTGAGDGRVVTAAGVTVDRSARRVMWHGREVELTRMEFDLLQLFVSRPDQVFTRQELLAQVWGYSSGAVTRTVDFHVAQLRHKLAAQLFETVRRVGYRFVTTAVALLVLLWAPARGHAEDRIPPRLVAAHDAYVRGDFAELVAAARDVLAAHRGEDWIEGNVLRLVERAFEFQPAGAAGPALPAGLTALEVCERRVDAGDGLTFELELRGDAALPVVDLRVTGPDGATILDKGAGKGAFRAYHERVHVRVDRRHDFTFRSAPAPGPLAVGLYEVSVHLAGRAPVTTWFLLTPNAAASSAPVLVAPRPGEMVSEPNPTVRWDGYTSPEWRRHERSSCRLQVVRLGDVAEVGGERLGDYWGANLTPGSGAIRVGQRYRDSGGYGETDLPSGRYWLTLTCAEQHPFGGLTLVRESAKRIPFSVLLP
jgi:DNA-binding response OmpR family regulator